MDIKNKIVELKNGEKYVVADSITYSNRTFLLVGKLLGEEIDTLEICELVGKKIEKILDEELSENIKQIFAMNLEIN